MNLKNSILQSSLSLRVVDNMAEAIMLNKQSVIIKGIEYFLDYLL